MGFESADGCDRVTNIRRAAWARRALSKFLKGSRNMGAGTDIEGFADRSVNLLTAATFGWSDTTSH